MRLTAAPHEKARHDRQNDRDEEHVAWINRVMDLYLVNHIENDLQDDDPASSQSLRAPVADPGF